MFGCGRNGDIMAAAPSPIIRRPICLGLIGLGCAALAGAASAAPATVPIARARPTATPVVAAPANLLTADRGQWSKLVGASFSVEGEAGSIMVTLKQVEALPSTGRSPSIGQREPFALHFTAPPGQTALRGGSTYLFATPGFSPFQLLVSALSAGAAGGRFIAILD